MDAELVPGAFVQHLDRPEWGIGQIQSAIGPKVTVNFEHVGKVVLDASLVRLRAVPRPSGRASSA